MKGKKVKGVGIRILASRKAKLICAFCGYASLRDNGMYEIWSVTLIDMYYVTWEEKGRESCSVKRKRVDCTLYCDDLLLNPNRPFATNDHMVQNSPCWRASSLLFPHWDIKTKRPEPVKLDLPLFFVPANSFFFPWENFTGNLAPLCR